MNLNNSLTSKFDPNWLTRLICLEINLNCLYCMFHAIFFKECKLKKHNCNQKIGNIFGIEKHLGAHLVLTKNTLVSIWYSQVVGLLQLCPCRKYCGFSITGIRVIPITTASGPASRVHGVMMPWLTWWRGLAESSSPLITATGPAERKREPSHKMTLVA